MDFFLFMVLICISAWVYSDAKSRNSSRPALWAIGVFLMFIIIFPLYLIMRPPKDNVIMTKAAPALCPHCGKYYEPPVIFCPHCGVKVND